MRIMGRSKGRARRAAIDKAFSRGAAAAMATANRGAQPRTVALGDAINALTGGPGRTNGLVIDDETRWMMRDPRDDVPFGPINPLRPDAIDPSRPDTKRPEPRLTEYPVAWNLPGSADAPMPWATLRAAAQNVDIMRRCISIRQEQLQGLDWSITLDDQTVQGMHAASAGDTGREDIEAELRRKLLPEIDRLTEFWRNPWKANGVSFEQWVNGIMEDHLVLDAVAIYPRMTYGGQLDAFELIDATTIKLLVDYRGARPVAPFPAFQQILHGFPRAEFGSCYAADGEDGVKPVEGMAADQLFYFREQYRSFTPYGYSAVAQALISARLYLRRQGWMLAEYDDGSTPLTFLVPDATDGTMVEKLTPRTRRQWEDSLNAELAGQTRARNRMKVLMPGMTPHQMQGVDERYKPDYDMHLIKMLAGHFGVTSTGLGFSESRGLGNSGLHEGQADVQQAATTKPDKRMIERIVNELMRTYQGAPAELRFKFTDPDTEDQSAEDAAANAQRARGTLTLNDDRKRLGKSPFPFPEADMPMVLAGNAWVPFEGMAARAEQAAEAEQALVDDQLATSEQQRELSAVEAEEVPADQVDKALELAAYNRWRRKRGGDARRPFICKALEPSDWPGQDVPDDIDFAEWVWVADGQDIDKAANDNWRTLARDSKGRWVKRGSMRVDALGPSTPDKPVLASLARDAERRRAAAARQLPVSEESSTVGGMTTPANLPPNPGIKTREQRVAELNAGMAAAMSGGPAPKGGMAERVMKRQEQAVRDVVTSLQDAPGGWVAMADVRRKLEREHGMDRGQQDAAIRRLVTTGDRALNTAPEDNQKTLTDADHAAAVDLGAGPQHVLSLDPPRAAEPKRYDVTAIPGASGARYDGPLRGDDDVMDLIEDMGRTGDGYASLEALRARMGGTHDEQTAALKRMDRARLIALDPDPLRATMTPERQAAAIQVGPEAKHLVRLMESREPRQTEQAQAARETIDSVPGLREGAARQQGGLTPALRAKLDAKREASAAAKREARTPKRGTAPEFAGMAFEHKNPGTGYGAPDERMETVLPDGREAGLSRTGESWGWFIRGAGALDDDGRGFSSPEAAAADMRAKAPRTAPDGPVTVREEGRQNNPGFALPTTPPAATRDSRIAAALADIPEVRQTTRGRGKAAREAFSAAGFLHDTREAAEAARRAEAERLVDREDKAAELDRAAIEAEARNDAEGAALARADRAQMRYEDAQARTDHLGDLAESLDTDEARARHDAAIAESEQLRAEADAAEDAYNAAQRPRLRAEQDAADQRARENLARINAERVERERKAAESAAAEVERKAREREENARRVAEIQSETRAELARRTPEAFALMLDGGDKATTHAPSRKILTEMREQGWIMTHMNGSMMRFEAPDGRAIRMRYGKDRVKWERGDYKGNQTMGEDISLTTAAALVNDKPTPAARAEAVAASTPDAPSAAPAGPTARRMVIPASVTGEQRASMEKLADKTDERNAAQIAESIEVSARQLADARMFAAENPDNPRAAEMVTQAEHYVAAPRGDAAVASVKGARELVARAEAEGYIVRVSHHTATNGAPFFKVEGMNPETKNGFEATWHTFKGKNGSYAFNGAELKGARHLRNNSASVKKINEAMDRDKPVMVDTEALAAELNARRNVDVSQKVETGQVEQGDWRWHPTEGWQKIGMIEPAKPYAHRVIWGEDRETKLGTLSHGSSHIIARQAERPTLPPRSEGLKGLQRKAGEAAKRGDVYIVERKDTTYYGGNTGTRNPRMSYEVYEVTSVTREGKPKKVRRMTDEPGSHEQTMDQFGSLGRALGYGTSSLVPGDAIDKEGLAADLRARTYKGSTMPRHHDDLRELGDVLYGRMKPTA